MARQIPALSLVISALFLCACTQEPYCWTERRMYAEESEVFSIGGCCDDDAYAFGLCDDAMVSCFDLDFILHLEDGYWVKMTILDDYICSNVWSSSKNDVYMTCAGGLVLHYNGTDWLETKLPSGQEYVVLRGIWGDGNGNVFIVGYQRDTSNNEVVSDYIAHFIANQWHEISTGEECRLKKVWGTSAANVFAVGECGVIHYDGTAWMKVEIGASGWVSDIWGTKESSVYALSDSIYHYDGNDWTAMDPYPDVFGFSKIDGTSDENIYGIGLRHVLHYDGARWRDVSPKGDYMLDDIWVSPGGDVYVVGYFYDPDIEISFSDGVIFKHICEVK